MEHNFCNGKKKYYVDDELIKHVPGNLAEASRFTSDVTFNVAGHRGKFRHRAIGRLTFYDLYIDGNKIQGSEQNAARLPLWVALLMMALLLLLVWGSMEFDKSPDNKPVQINQADRTSSTKLYG
ncbi:MAG: hypothetical protein WD572_04100 [Gammaproteobacteria bacterium]